MLMKKIYYETTEEVRTRIQRSSIVIDTDYTQIYDEFNNLSRKISNGTSYKLLFWLLAKKISKDMSLIIDTIVYSDFARFLSEECDNCELSRRQFNNCVRELTEAGALIQAAKGHYYVNARCIWKGPVKERENFLQLEAAYNKYQE